MDIERINLYPRFTKNLVKKKYFKDDPFVIVDVGARGGLEPQWAVFDKQIKFIGFEPDNKECLELGSGNRGSKQHLFYPFALFKDQARHPFYNASLPDSSGIYPPDPDIVGRFPDEKNLSVKSVQELKTIDFDSFSSLHKIDRVDFIKLDTEGSECDILEGALGSIKKSVLGISCEAYFSPWHKGQKLFSAIDDLLRSLGFCLFDLSLTRQARKAFPELRSAVLPRSSSYGQAVCCDVLYLRDAVSEIRIKKHMLDPWDKARILKLIALFEIFRLPDCALELLLLAREKNIIDFSDNQIRESCDQLISGFTGKSYSRYLLTLKKIEKRGYVNNAGRFVSYLRNSAFVRKQYYRLAPILGKSPFLIKSMQYLLKR